MACRLTSALSDKISSTVPQGSLSLSIFARRASDAGVFGLRNCSSVKRAF